MYPERMIIIWWKSKMHFHRRAKKQLTLLDTNAIIMSKIKRHRGIKHNTMHKMIIAFYTLKV